MYRSIFLSYSGSAKLNKSANIFPSFFLYVEKHSHQHIIVNACFNEIVEFIFVIIRPYWNRALLKYSKSIVSIYVFHFSQAFWSIMKMRFKRKKCVTCMNRISHLLLLLNTQRTSHYLKSINRVFLFFYSSNSFRFWTRQQTQKKF